MSSVSPNFSKIVKLAFWHQLDGSGLVLGKFVVVFGHLRKLPAALFISFLAYAYIEVSPYCGCKHSVFKQGLQDFCKLHGHLLGGGPTAKERDNLMNQISYSVRIVLRWYRKCRFELQASKTCQNIHKKNSSEAQAELATMNRLIELIQETPKKKAADEDDEEGTSNLQAGVGSTWATKSSSAPVPVFWQGPKKSD